MGKARAHAQGLTGSHDPSLSYHRPDDDPVLRRTPRAGPRDLLTLEEYHDEILTLVEIPEDVDTVSFGDVVRIRRFA